MKSKELYSSELSKFDYHIVDINDDHNIMTSKFILNEIEEPFVIDKSSNDLIELAEWLTKHYKGIEITEDKSLESEVEFLMGKDYL